MPRHGTDHAAARSDTLLDRAGTLLMLELGGYLALGMYTGNDSLALSAVLLVNLVPATLLTLAAKAQGRNVVGLGLLALMGPFGGLYALWMLNRSGSRLRARSLATLAGDLPDRYVDANGVVHERGDESKR